MTALDIPKLSVFPIGESNDGFARYFSGQSYLCVLSSEQMFVGNVTFEPMSLSQV